MFYTPDELSLPADGVSFIKVEQGVPGNEDRTGALESALFYPDLSSLLAAGLDIDVVSICMAIKSIEAGYHIVVEKPLALTVSEAERVVFTSLKYRKQVFCVMQNRYSPPSVWIKELIDSKKLGDLYMVQLNCYWNRDDRYYKPGGWHGTALLDGGTLFTQFSHFIDIMYWLFGDITNIQARFRDFNHSRLTDLKIRDS
jgi:UDP-N-acetyl-2-amino-2-deoxyglucuronate dehydrogenase